MSRRQVQQERARLAFDRVMALLQTELALGTARRHLDVLLELAECHLDALEGTALSAAMAERLSRARDVVRARHHLRLVKGAKND
jgi:hypothetical protein